MMDVFFSSKTVIRTGKTGAFTEDVLNFYQIGDRWLEHSNTDGVVHQFSIFVRGNRPESILTSGFLWQQGIERLWGVYSQRQNEQTVLLAELCDRNQFEQHLRAVIFPKI